jgi:hypothetical protein
VTPPNTPHSGPEPAGGHASVTAVAGLAREIEGLRRSVDTTSGVAGRVEDLAAVVADLAITVEQLMATPTVVPPVCWLDFADDQTTAFAVLGKLAAWLEAVYLRYGDAALPDCWAWHPDVVEELLWLSQAWQAAYTGPRPSITAVADWHDRQRPGVARRITAVARGCSIETHQTPAGAPAVPMLDALHGIAGWWANHRTDPAPGPTADQLATAAVSSRGRR